MTNPIAAQVLPLLKPFEANRTSLAWRALGTVWLIFLGYCLVVFLHPGLAAADLEWTNGAGFRSAPITPRAPGKNGFTKLEITTTGIHFTNQLGDDRSIFNRNLLSGSGVAAGDIDGDGRCDLYFCGLDNRNALFRNLGDWKFEDVTAASGVACDNEDATAAALADIDGDGDLDLLVNCLSNGTRIFQNDGKGKFTEITDAAGVRSKTGSMSMTLADIDGDSDLDLYIVNYRPVTIMDAPSTQFRIQMVGNRALVALVNGRPATLPEYTNRFVVTPSGNVLELGQPDVLYRNDGRGRFTPVSFTGGAFRDEDGNVLREPPRDWGLAAQFHDMNVDGAPDLYVCNDLFSPDRVWMNDGKGNFRALPPLALRSTSTFSMGVDFADVDRDDDVDFFVVDMLSREHQKRHVQVGESSPVFFPPGLIDNQPQYLRNTLQVNRGDTTFAETSFFSGLEASEWSWGPIFLDVDLDGFEDILVTNGQHRDFQNVDLANRMEATRAAKGLTEEDRVRFVKMFPSLESPNLIFRNRGDLTFEEVGAAWGFATPGISQGAALADLDNDGDLDVVMNNLNSAAGIYRNDTAAPRVAIRLKGRAPNTQGVGANIRVTGGPVAQAQEMICAGRYLSADDAMRVFAGGTNSKPLTIEVRWRSGRVSHITNAVANRIYEIAEPEVQETTPPIEGKKAPSPVFVDVSHLLNHLHHEEPFDDFERQPLLPNRLSQLGPGVCWHDLDGDGWDDLFIGSGRGGKLAIFRNNTQGGFQPMDSPANRTVTRDQTALLGYSSLLLAGSSNFEDGLTNGAAVKLFAFLQNKADDSFPGRLSSTGPLALADIDGDDDLDLFVGGRMIPGRYPEPATSWIMRNDAGKFALVQSLENVGLVSGAVFSDLNGDGRPDLVLACDWGPVRVFQNRSGAFHEVTKELGLADWKGWWTGVTTGDFDGDGRLDIVAANWGLNSKYRIAPGRSRKLYFGDLDDNGTFDLIETYFEPVLGKEVPERTLRSVAMGLPWLPEQIGTFEKYGSQSVQEIYGNKLSRAGVVELNTLASTVFFNRNGRFDPRPLPREAQLAPAFGVAVADFDGDGHDDLFLSQNFFAVAPDAARCDAGRGLWLRGDGKGGFQPVEGHESGVMVYGEQRGCAVSDYDGDGRVDLVVTQNGNRTRLLRNVGGRPGLRVRLKGTASNPTGVGAVMRLKFGERFGPAREVHAGSGYWSQDSAVSILSLPQPPAQIWIRWPGGKETISAVPEGAREIAVNAAGEVEKVK